LFDHSMLDRPASITDWNGQAHECLAEAFDTTFNVLILVYPVKALTGKTFIILAWSARAPVTRKAERLANAEATPSKDRMIGAGYCHLPSSAGGIDFLGVSFADAMTVKQRGLPGCRPAGLGRRSRQGEEVAT
jgi:hypothetical protein